MRAISIACFSSFAFFLSPAAFSAPRTTEFDARIAHYAEMHGVPESLVHRVIRRESRYNPRAQSRGNFGLMQIKHATARGMGYRGAPQGLLDVDTNLAYGVPYLANAWRLANGSEARAVSLYSGGYYHVAKRRGLLGAMRSAHSPRHEATVETAAETAPAAYAPPQPEPAPFAGVTERD